MSVVQYLPVATAANANVDSQDDFAGAAYQQNGFVNGTALPAQINKIMRQASVPSSALTNWISQTLNVDILDDGNQPALTAQIQAAVSTVVAQGTSGILHQPTATAGDNSTLVSNTAFVQSAVASAEAVAAAASAAIAANLAALAAGFASQLAGNGYTKLPNGLILQWVSGAQDTAGGSTITQSGSWAIPFPSACFAAFVSANWISSGDSDIVSYQIVSTSLSGWNLRRARGGNYTQSLITFPTLFAVGN